MWKKGNISNNEVVGSYFSHIGLTNLWLFNRSIDDNEIDLTI